MRTAVVVLGALGVGSAALAAGNGAGAGGAGHQRAINSGLPAGASGPAGAPNNPRRLPKPTADGKDAPSAKGTPAR